jgi:site-specific DNA recombinase
MKRVAIYIRVSTTEQAEEGFSVPAQKEKLINYCKAREWIISDIYIDPGFTGSNLNRPAMQKLIAEIKNFDIVLVYRLDRLSRSQKDTLHLIEDVFLKNSVDFISLTESFDTSTPFGRASIGILSVFAQLERENIIQRMKLGKEGRAKSGLFHGGGRIPIGYDFIDGQLTINNYEALQIKEVYKLYSEGHGINKIAELMKNKGFRHKYGKWNKSAVMYVIDNSLYIGKISHKKKEFTGKHEAIIEEELFHKSKDLKNNRRVIKRKAFESNSLLAGFLFCGSCGARYHKSIDKKTLSGEIKRYEYYRCYSRTKIARWMIKDHNCKNKTWRMEELDGIVTDCILRLSLDKEYLKQVKKKPVKKDNTKPLIEKKILQLDKQIDKLLDLYQVEEVSNIKKIGERISLLHKEK